MRHARSVRSSPPKGFGARGVERTDFGLTPLPNRPSLIGLSQHGNALVAQLDRASDYGSEGWEFESLRAHVFPRKAYWFRGVA